MKIIFLEIRGVLLHATSHMIARLNQKDAVAYAPSVEALNYIINNTKAQIVITSSWREAGLENLQNKFKEWEVVTTSFDRTPTGRGKGNSILKWMSMDGVGEPESFVIIDSSSKEYGRMLLPFLIETDGDKGGLNMEQAKKAVEMLNGK